MKGAHPCPNKVNFNTNCLQRPSQNEWVADMSDQRMLSLGQKLSGS